MTMKDTTIKNYQICNYHVITNQW